MAKQVNSLKVFWRGVRTHLFENFFNWVKQLFIAFKKWVSNLPMKFLSYVYNKYSYNMGITTLRLQEQYYKHLSLAKEIRIAVGDVFLKAWGRWRASLRLKRRLLFSLILFSKAPFFGNLVHFLGAILDDILGCCNEHTSTTNFWLC